jgi:hypothetical protein
MTWKACRGRYLLSIALFGCLVGCKGIFGSQGLPQDPLFLDKRPLEAKAIFAPPVTIAYSEPLPPTNPYLAQRGSNSVPGTLTNRPATNPGPADDR